MASTDPISTRNLDGYDAPPIDWDRVRSILDGDMPQAPDTGGPNRHTTWLTTINPDGAPHVTPVGAGAVDHEWYFTSGPGTRKSRNLVRDARCALSIATHPFDLVLEGRATRVVDPAVLQAVAAEYNAGGWPCSVDGDALTAPFSAPSAGPPPWNVYRFDAATVFAFGTAEPYGAARFDLAEPS
jgi:hypothetical protein